jgi:hypothetical protein
MKRRDATSQKKECLKITAEKAENITFNLLAGEALQRAKSRCHGKKR